MNRVIVQYRDFRTSTRVLIFIDLASAFGEHGGGCSVWSVQDATRHELVRSFSEMDPVPGDVPGRVRAENRRGVAGDELARVVGPAVAAARGQSNVLPEPCVGMRE